MKNLKKFRAYFIEALKSLYTESEALELFNQSLEDQLKLSPIEIALDPGLEMNVSKLEKTLDRLIAGEPYQYIQGKTQFMGLDFLVNPNVLIPRPETEELVNWLIEQCPKEKTVKIIDLCTGSGCIAISLAKFLGKRAEITGLDYSTKALEVARQNAKLNQVEINWIECDLLALGELDKHYDIIISNPPYVRVLEKEEIKANVLEHEPHMALFVADDDALIFYKKIAQLAKGRPIYFEINQYLGKQTVELLKTQKYSSIALKKDFRGNDRMIHAS
ncbi:peptide chain release factor N(5)-glutamine methyltransferase [Flavobacteriaceae bacterium]|nr:peptide chain release factor N(5)-glutamine methyltransferase [Flavobacteriaceae bacterium]